MQENNRACSHDIKVILVRKISRSISYGVIGHSHENFVRVIGVPN